MSATDEYRRFLERADRIFLHEGAQQLLAPDAGPGVPAWARQWDRLYMLSGPGNQVMLAIVQADDLSGDELRSRWDGLARGIASAGAIQGPTMNLVVVTVFARSGDSGQRRSIRRMTPPHFLPGLRPCTWTVDLTSGQVETGSALRRPEAAGWLAMAVQGAEPNSEVSGNVDQRRNDGAAFYRLMQGRRPYMTILLIAINVAVYGLVSLNGGAENDATLRRFGALFYDLALQGQWWRLFTTMFLHLTPEHILFNMVSLFAVGTLAERLYGHAKFLAIYLGSGMIASATSLAWAVAHNGTHNAGIGASGAIFGIAGALLTVRFQSSSVIPRGLRQRVTASMVPMVVLSLVLSQYMAANVDSSAHVGGVIGGALLSMVFTITRSAGVPASVEAPVPTGSR